MSSKEALAKDIHYDLMYTLANLRVAVDHVGHYIMAPEQVDWYNRVMAGLFHAEQYAKELSDHLTLPIHKG